MGAGKVAQWLEAYGAPAENPKLVSHSRVQKLMPSVSPVPGDSTTSSGRTKLRQSFVYSHRHF